MLKDLQGGSRRKRVSRGEDGKRLGQRVQASVSGREDSGLLLSGRDVP